MKLAFTGMRRAVVSGVMLLLLVSGLATGRASVAGHGESAFAPATNQSVALCRFGVGGTSDMTAYPVQDLRLGWYVDWRVTTNPAPPEGVEYLPMVRLSQTGLDTYSYVPDRVTLETMAANRPGMTWLIGNEPDRRRWQDDLEPHVYARAYHDLYHILKEADPTAQIAAGGIVQPTPVRLLYLDMILDSYRQRYGEPMPVDVWNIHAFILRERSCQYYPEDCWGAEIPPGITWPQGELYEIQDNDNLEVFKQFVQNFRAWMFTRGYQNRPLIITEFGVQMPAMYGFTAQRVNAYMNATFEYLRTATNAQGYPADGNRLVQRWAWYSLTDSTFNGWLYDPGPPPRRTAFGDNFAAFTAQISPQVNLTPVQLGTVPAAPFSPTDPVTLTLTATIANNGNIAFAGPVVVRFYAGAPYTGQQIGGDQMVTNLAGCAATMVVSVPMFNVAPGSLLVYVVVDPDGEISESDESDNMLTGRVLVSTQRLFLPMVHRRH